MIRQTVLGFKACEDGSEADRAWGFSVHGRGKPWAGIKEFSESAFAFTWESARV